MKRKVIQIASFTHAVSLPSKWVKKCGIKKGDELDIQEKGHILNINGMVSPEDEKAEIKVTDAKSFKRRYLNTLYKKGYNDITIRFKDPSVALAIKDEVELLLGFEVVNEGENVCTIKNVAPTLDKEFDSMLRRVFLMLVSMSKDSYDAATRKEYERLSSIAKLEKTHNKLTNFCERALNLHGYNDNKETNMVYAMIWTLEQVTDNLRDLCQYMADSKIKLSKETLKFYNETTKFIEMFQNLFYKRTNEQVIMFKDKFKDNLNKKSFELLEEGRKKEAIVVYYLKSVIDKVYHITLSFGQK